MKKTDAGYSGGSGFETVGSILRSDASQSVDRGWVGGEADGAKGFEPLAGGDELSCYGFPEDGREDDQVCVLPGLLDFGKRVTGDGDDRRRQFGHGVKFPDLRGGELAGSGGQVNSVSGGGDGYIGAGVDEELCPGVAEDFEDAAGEGRQGGGRQVFFAELDVVDAVGRPEGGLVEEGGELFLPPFAMKLRRMGHPGLLILIRT